MNLLATYTGGASPYLVVFGSLGPLALMGGVMYLSNKLVKRNRARAAARSNQ